jgi:predicted RNA-binding Zn-ribbon protein involved in translation (DUF1610 family)
MEPLMVLQRPNELGLKFIHVHICVHCGKAFRREEVEGRGHTTGLFLCPQCGVEGPLNIDIREINESQSHLANGA